MMYQMCGCVYFTLKYNKKQDVCDVSDRSKGKEVGQIAELLIIDRTSGYGIIVQLRIHFFFL